MSLESRVEADEQELQALVDAPYIGCAFKGCKESNVDERGPVWMNAQDGTAHDYWVCTQHWDSMFNSLDWQDMKEEDATETDDDLRDLQEVLEELKKQNDEPEEYFEFDGSLSVTGNQQDETEAENFNKGYDLMDDAGRNFDDDDW